MRFNTFGNKTAPVIIMLTGSFCPARSMEYLYSELKKDFYIIAPDYNGHYKESKSFTTRQKEAAEIAEYLVREEINSVRLIYGQSMGAEISIELISQLIKKGITAENALLDGAPCIRLSKAYKAFMLFKFRSMIKMFKNKSVDEAMNTGIIKAFYKNDAEVMRSMIEPLAEIAGIISDESIKNEVECCYTFDFPPFDEKIQKNMHFFYDRDEKACRTCLKGVQKAYPHAEYIIKSGYGHLTYSQKCRTEYIGLIKKICKVR